MGHIRPARYRRPQSAIDREACPLWFAGITIAFAVVGYFAGGRIGAIEGAVIAMFLAHGALLEVLRSEREERREQERKRISFQMVICPQCGKPHENVRGKCPFCGSDFHGHIRGKYAVQPRDLGPKFRCAHGIALHRPCQNYERSAEECEVYRRPILADLRKVALHFGVRESEADEGAKLLLVEIDAREAQENR
jgi:hypothetical protein